MRKKLIILLIFAFTLSGCNQKKENVNLPSTKDSVRKEEMTDKPDYQHVIIIELNQSSMIIAPPVTDPEASYPAYEIYIDEHTKIEGSKKNFAELEVGNQVEVWVVKKEINKEFADKIVVID